MVVWFMAECKVLLNIAASAGFLDGERETGNL